MASSSSSVVANHYNAVPNKGRAERQKSIIFHLRNFNNWIKSQLIGEFLDRIKKDNSSKRAEVLDLCCGKGGDLLKWKIGNIGRLVLADIAEVSLDQCKSRYEDMVGYAKRDRRQRGSNELFLAEFIHADCSRVRLLDVYQDKSAKFDLCSCQFSLHYAFASEEQAHRMLANACESLRPGGYFIGTLPDANQIFWCIKEKGNDGRYANRVCTIDYEDKAALVANTDYQPPLYGAEFQFTLDEVVVNCPEYLVYFPHLEKLLVDEFDMELVYKKRFPDAFDYYLQTNRDARTLLQRMQALEPYPTDDHDAGDDEYQMARETIEKMTAENKRRKVATLSQSEWQVASMYLVFAFRKKTSPSGAAKAGNGKAADDTD